jgi:hypothetical protein
MKAPRYITWIETGSPWLTPWEPQGAGSLHDRLRSGRPPQVTSEEQALAIAYTYLKEEPRALAQAMDRIAQKMATHLWTSALEYTRIDFQISVSCMHGIKSGRNPVASHRMLVVIVLGLSMSKRFDCGVGKHPEQHWLTILNDSALDMYVDSMVLSLHALLSLR